MTCEEPKQSIVLFLYGGLAWTRYDLTNSDVNLSDIRDEDDVLEIPLGIGIAGRYKGLMVDLRGEYRVATEEDLVPSILVDEFADPDSAEDMHRYGVNATIGYEF